MKGVRNMEKEREKPRVLPQPPHKPELVDPIIANGTLHFPGQSHTYSDAIITDPDGSYTGRPLDGGKPVQDADDL